MFWPSAGTTHQARFWTLSPVVDGALPRCALDGATAAEVPARGGTSVTVAPGTSKIHIGVQPEPPGLSHVEPVRVAGPHPSNGTVHRSALIWVSGDHGRECGEADRLACPRGHAEGTPKRVR